jgi:3-methyladenine DNA glycosylase Mpg
MLIRTNGIAKGMRRCGTTDTAKAILIRAIVIRTDGIAKGMRRCETNGIAKAILIRAILNTT